MFALVQAVSKSGPKSVVTFTVARCNFVYFNRNLHVSKFLMRAKKNIHTDVTLNLSPGKMLLTMFLVQKWLGSPFPEDV